MESPSSTNSWILANMGMAEAWKLYQVLRPYISRTEIEDEIGFIADNLESPAMLQSLDILFSSRPDNLGAFDMALGFMQGVDASGFITFIKYIRDFSNGGKQ